MRPEDVPAELVERAAQAIHKARCLPDCRVERPHTEENQARHALAAVLPEVKRESHRAGYEMARDDMASGAFIGGPTYEALRDSFAGRQIAKEALESAQNDVIDQVGEGRTADIIGKRAARLTATTEEPTDA